MAKQTKRAEAWPGEARGCSGGLSDAQCMYLLRPSLPGVICEMWPLDAGGRFYTKMTKYNENAKSLSAV